MKRLLLLFVTMATISACGQENESPNPGEALTSRSKNSRLTGKLNVSSFSKVERSNLRSKLSVKLTTKDGRELENTSALQPNTIYKLNLKSVGANQIELRSAFGFEVLETNDKINDGNFSAEYLIKTQSDVTEPLFVSFLPLSKSNGRVNFREQAQNFFLTKN